jgi:hypothetical protein
VTQFRAEITGWRNASGRLQSRLPIKIIELMKKILWAEARVLASQVQRRHMTGGTTPSRLRVRSGQLRASVKPVPVTQTESTVESGISFGTKYARTHVGPRGQVTTIKPVRRKWLTIPLKAAMTPAGVARGAAQSGMWGETFFRRTADGKLILFGKRVVQRGASAGMARGSVVPLFLLVKKVKIPARVHPEQVIGYAKPRIIKELRQAGVRLGKETVT